ncbi:MAG: hypothetical protein AAF958_10095 [Planctomycetota bacterium]
MLGPIFYREAAVQPRRSATYVARGTYVLTLFVLLCTGYLVLDGSRSLGGVGDSARFGGWIFSILAPLQFLVLTALAAVGAASSVAQEKDRRTLLLLLMTRLSGTELVGGKLAATLLGPLAMLVAALPLFLALPILGGVSPGQVLSVTAVTTVSVLLAAAVGTMMGLWREKTFQAIAMTVMTLLIYIAIGHALGTLLRLPEWLRIGLSPLAALASAASPLSSLLPDAAAGVSLFVILNAALFLLVTIVSIRKVRHWNPSRDIRIKPVDPETGSDLAAAEAAGEATPTTWKVREPRPVWNNPILWREVRTWAYGRKIVLIRVAFLMIFAIVAGIIVTQIQNGTAFEPGGRIGRALPAVTLPMALLGVVSLVLVNALAVNSVTGERDGLALDLLLVTDLRPSEFIFGKLGGVFYVAKEMILLPIGLIIFLAARDVMTWENAIYAVLGAFVLYVFVSMLGVHSGLNYVASRTAILASLGTVFFLCVGIAVCMTIMVSFRGSFQYQLPPFLVMILGGGAALFAAIGWRNPSSAVLMSSMMLPMVTFYAITQFILQTDNLYVFVTLAFGYAFTTAAMMIPALSEFDVSLGRDRKAGGEGG